MTYLYPIAESESDAAKYWRFVSMVAIRCVHPLL